MSSNRPPLKALHPESSLVGSKLDKFRKISTKELVDSLVPGQAGSLKARPDGTMIEGHHRIKVLRERGIDVDSLPREIISREGSGNSDFGSEEKPP